MKYRIENEQVNYECDQKAQGIVDINGEDDDDNKNNETEEPIEQDNKSPRTYGIYLYQPRCLALSN
jgi:hypothetical protein